MRPPRIRAVTLTLELQTRRSLAELRKARRVSISDGFGRFIAALDVEQATASVVQPVKPAKGGKP